MPTESVMSRTLIVQLTAMLVFGCGMLAALEAHQSGEWGPGASGATGDPVLVLFVGRHFDRIVDTINPDRVLAVVPGAIATHDGLIMAVDAAAVGEAISEAGWIDRSIEIFDAGKDDDGPRWADAGDDSRRVADGDSSDFAAPGASESDRRERLRELMGKKELSRGEQIFVMSAMNDGIEL